MKDGVRITLVSALGVVALTVATAVPASAWGGPGNFSNNNCTAYSVAETANGLAGAYTMRFSGTGSVKVAFRDLFGNMNIESVLSPTGSVARSWVDDVMAQQYGALQSGSHWCGSSPRFAS